MIFLNSLKKTIIYKKLVQKENELEDHEISEKLKSILNDIIPILTETRHYLHEYTLHDYSHSLSILEIIEKIIPKSTLDNLNLIELSLIIYSAFMHDIGMACSNDERSAILNSEEFKKFYNSYAEDDLDFIFSEYIRKKHAQRSYDFIIKNFKNKISYKNIDYSECLANICLGHCLDSYDLNNEKQFPKQELISEFECNIHYLALILRLADYLDIFPQRAPLALYKFISPKNKISIIEWQKHMSISGWKFSSNKIRISAKCKNIEYERAVRETLKGINAEKKEIYAAIKDYDTEVSKKYKFQILEDINLDDIKNDGSYIFDDLEFDIDYKSVLTLLMGEKLYSSPEIAIRELLQNSIDAINFRKKLQQDKFEPYIEVNFDGKSLSIIDNGIGMDDYIFKNYFLKVGKSFYKSKDARALVSDYDSISEFGIGILSCFMVADSIEVESKRFSLDINKPNEPIFVEIPTAYSYMIKKKSQKQHVGTRITLNLKENHPFKNLSKLISKIALLIDYEINCVENGKKVLITPKVIDKKLVDNIVSPYKCNICFEVDFSKSKNEIVRDIEGKVFFISTESTNYNMDDWRYKLKRFTYQNGFLIENSRDKESNENDIFPYCGDVSIVANFQGKSKLNISVDRSRFIEDDKYYKVEKLIEEEIANKLYEYLLPYHKKLPVEDYYTFQYEFFSKFNMDLDFFIDKGKLSNIIYVCLLDYDGSYKYMSVADLSKYQKFIYIDNLFEKPDPYEIFYNRKILMKELSNIFGKNFDIPVMSKSAANCNGDAMFFGSRQAIVDSYLITATNSYKAVILFDISEKDIATAVDTRRLGELRFVKNVLSPYTNNNLLFVNYESENLYFNLSHPFFVTFMKKAQNNTIDESVLIDSLSPLLEINIYNARQRYKQIFTKVWNNLKKNKIIPNNKKMPVLTLDDLPVNQLR